MMNMLMKLFRDEEGQGLVEYALIIVLISIAVIAVMVLLGDQIEAAFVRITTALRTGS